jgi:hypothetical protein
LCDGRGLAGARGLCLRLGQSESGQQSGCNEESQNSRRTNADSRTPSARFRRGVLPGGDGDCNSRFVLFRHPREFFGLF